jgi:hypothetical protein
MADGGLNKTVAGSRLPVSGFRFIRRSTGNWEPAAGNHLSRLLTPESWLLFFLIPRRK